MALYVRPTTLTEALAALAARPLTVLAGGTDHYPARVLHAPDEHILDLMSLPGLRASEARADHWWLPCQATWTDLIEADLPPGFAALKQAARQVGGVQIQNSGTLVGNVCNASPAADGIPCLMALDAEIELASLAGNRRLALADFLLGPRRTARRPDELATGLRIPKPTDTGSVFLKLGGRRYLVISIAMVAANLEIHDGIVTQARIAIGACSARAMRLPALESALIGHPPDPASITQDHLADLAPIDDIRASAAYRRHAALELVRRAIAGFAPARDIAA